MDKGRGEFSEYTGRWEAVIRELWGDLPAETRSDLQKILFMLPGDRVGWRALIDRAVEQLRLAAGRKQRVAILGPANGGKSTLYNALIRSQANRARVSAVPGTTQVAQDADTGLFIVVDTPGADAVGSAGSEAKKRAFEAAEASDFLILLFDATHGIRESEKDIYKDLQSLGKPMVVALNKIDLVGRERAQVLEKAADGLRIRSDQIIPLSAKNGSGFGRLMQAIVKTEPELVAGLGAALPEYRLYLAQGTILRAASTAAAIALTPLPFLDFFPLTGIQVAMVLGIARIYAYRITLARVKELIATFGFAWLGRTLFYELSRFGGPPGWLVAAGVAAGTTVALGYASIVWFDRGVRVSRGTLLQINRRVGVTILRELRSLGRRRPDRKLLRQRVNKILLESDFLRSDGETERPEGEGTVQARKN